MYKYFDKLTVRLGIYCFIYVILSAFMWRITGLSLHLMMGWNLFLAFLPLFFAALAQYSVENCYEKCFMKCFTKLRKILTALFFLLWLLFFPNAPYMVTDLIHISSMDFYGSYPYTTDIILWLRLVHIAVGVILSTLTAVYSLYKIHRILLHMRSKITANAALVFLCFLGGYAIYIGRFLRFNSWDILKPLSLISKLISNLDLFCLCYSSLFAVYILFVYFLFCSFISSKASGI